MQVIDSVFAGVFQSRFLPLQSTSQPKSLKRFS